jgi:hypothetical protein
LAITDLANQRDHPLHSVLYARRFSKDVDDIVKEFVEEGINVPLSFAPPGNVKKIEEDIPRMAAVLIAMSHKVNGVTFY